MKEKRNTYFSINLVKKDNILMNKRLLLLAIDGKEIEGVASIKLLGISLDEHLTWKNDISIVENNISKNI